MASNNLYHMPPDHPHKGWHNRGYLPHLDCPGLIQAITFRLADAVPKKVIDRWKVDLEREGATDIERQKALRKNIALFEDAGHGVCELRNPSCAAVMRDALFHFDGDRYRLLDWCVMPNHIHLLIYVPEGSRIGDLVKSWKIHTCREINRLLGRSSSLWAKDYHDRFIRDERHLNSARAYIRRNPVKACLCENPEDWPWSSAYQTGSAGL